MSVRGGHARYEWYPMRAAVTEPGHSRLPTQLHGARSISRSPRQGDGTSTGDSGDAEMMAPPDAGCCLVVIQDNIAGANWMREASRHRPRLDVVCWLLGEDWCVDEEWTGRT